MYQPYFKTSLTLRLKKYFLFICFAQRALIKLTNETNVHSEVKCRGSVLEDLLPPPPPTPDSARGPG